MNPTISIVLTVSSASEAIEAYKAITAACVPVSVSVSPVAPVQSSGCSASVRVSEEQELRDEYKSKHPLGRGFRLLREQAVLHKSNPLVYPRIKFLREAVEQLRAGTFVVTQEDNEPQVGENHADTGEYF